MDKALEIEYKQLKKQKNHPFGNLIETAIKTLDARLLNECVDQVVYELDSYRKNEMHTDSEKTIYMNTLQYLYELYRLYYLQQRILVVKNLGENFQITEVQHDKDKNI